VNKLRIQLIEKDGHWYKGIIDQFRPEDWVWVQPTLGVKVLFKDRYYGAWTYHTRPKWLRVVQLVFNLTRLTDYADIPPHIPPTAIFRLR